MLSLSCLCGIKFLNNLWVGFNQGVLWYGSEDFYLYKRRGPEDESRIPKFKRWWESIHWRGRSKRDQKSGSTFDVSTREFLGFWFCGGIGEIRSIEMQISRTCDLCPHPLSMLLPCFEKTSCFVCQVFGAVRKELSRVMQRGRKVAALC